MSKKNGLADPIRLKPFDADDKQMLRVVIETPKGSRNKFAFNPEEHIFELKKVLPAGMTFPYDFGFVPSTKADDGDPVDVLVLMDEPAFPGCVLTCRPIGVIEGEQGEKKDKVRNDRIIAVEQDAHSWADIKTIDDLGKEFCRELEEFFVNYHKLSGRKIPGAGGEGAESSSKTGEIRDAMRIESDEPDSHPVPRRRCSRICLRNHRRSVKTEELRRAIRCCAVSRACDFGADGSDRRCILRRH